LDTPSASCADLRRVWDPVDETPSVFLHFHQPECTRCGMISWLTNFCNLHFSHRVYTHDAP
jgi:hypothetical protein